MMLRTLVIIGFALVMASSCSRNKAAKSVPQAPQRNVRAVKIGETERGIASWYGDPYHGRTSANGEVFNMNEKTAAHRTMPFGTWVRVENESNSKRVNVRITDRGPFVGDRIIDLSRKAAEDIAMIGPGTAMVKLTVIDAPRGEVVEKYGVQIAAWEDRLKAEALKKEIERVVKPVRVVEKLGSPVLYRVIAGEGTREEADAIARKLRDQGHRGFVTRQVP
jgi:rare lipoprotein A